MAVPQRLTAVTLGVRDFGRMRGFYEGWGWSTFADADQWVAFQVGSLLLCLWPLEVLGEEAAAGLLMPEVGTWNGITLAINVAEKGEVDGVWRAAVEAGATPISEPTDRAYGPRAGYVADPEDNRWEIVWAPEVPLL